MRRKVKDLSGTKFGRWTVISMAEKRGKAYYWKCMCDCKNRTIKEVASSSLIGGCSKSCGCLNKELTYKRNKKYNKYNLDGDFGIGYDIHDNEFWFDKEDHNKIKDHCWCIDSQSGYICTLINGKRVRMHRLVMDVLKNKEFYIDHINKDPKDNRKNNLRLVTKQQNVMNRSATGKSGVTGVSFNKKDGKWAAYIGYNYETIRLGSYEDKQDAIIARLKKEKELFGEYSGQRHLFDKYNI